MKLGPHVLHVTPTVKAWAKVAPIVKICDFDGDAARALLLLVQPGAIIIWRHWWGSQPAPQRVWDDPGWAVAEILKSLGGFRSDNLYVETTNEEKQNLGEGLEESVAWHQRVVPLLHMMGIKVAGFGFSTGNPKGYPKNPDGLPDSYTYLVDHAWAGVDAVGLGEYWGGGGMPGTGWNTLRYRKLHDWTGGLHPALYIREGGRDTIQNPAGDRSTGAGWKLQNISPADYFAELQRLEALWNENDYLLGGNPFTSGEDAKWVNYGLDTLPMANTFRGLPPRTHWENAVATTATINALKALALKLNGPGVAAGTADPSGIWQQTGIMPLGGDACEAWLDTPAWRLLHAANGYAIEQKVEQPPNS